MTDWIEETFHPHWRVRLEATRVLHEVKTEHQHLVIFENPTWGTVLMLDGVCQLTTSDEFVYHEMMAHVPLMALNKPKRVLVIGGGDGGVLREVLKHPSVEKATLCEIDRTVIDTALGPIGSELSTMMASNRSSVSATYFKPSAMTISARLSSNTLPGMPG